MKKTGIYVSKTILFLKGLGRYNIAGVFIRIHMVIAMTDKTAIFSSLPKETRKSQNNGRIDFVYSLVLSFLRRRRRFYICLTFLKPKD